MTALPTAAIFTAGATTNLAAKTAQDDMLAFIRQMLGGAAETTLTLAADAATPTAGVHAIDTQGAAGADDLKTIVTTNLPDGSFLLIRAANAARVVTVKHAAGGAGQVALAGAADLVLDATTKHLLLRRAGADWIEVLRSHAAATEGVAGVAKVATQALARGGANDTDFMTPLKTKAATLLATLTASASTELDFTAGDAALYAGYRFVLENILPATDAAVLQVQTSANAGSSFDTAGYYYRASVRSMEAAPTIAENSGGANVAAIAITRPATSGIDNSIGNYCGEVEVRCNAARAAMAAGGVYVDSGGSLRLSCEADGFSPTAAANAVRFKMSAGNITSGVIRCYGIPK